MGGDRRSTRARTFRRQVIRYLQPSTHHIFLFRPESVLVGRQPFAARQLVVFPAPLMVAFAIAPASITSFPLPTAPRTSPTLPSQQPDGVPLDSYAVHAGRPRTRRLTRTLAVSHPAGPEEAAHVAPHEPYATYRSLYEPLLDDPLYVRCHGNHRAVVVDVREVELGHVGRQVDVGVAFDDGRRLARAIVRLLQRHPVATEVGAKSLQQVLLAQVLLRRHEGRLQPVAALGPGVADGGDVVGHVAPTAAVVARRYRRRLAELDGDGTDGEGRLWPGPGQRAQDR